ncbi:MAG: hypothetical protein ACTHJ0_10245 [Flavipsychrobacter sp.]
MNLFGAVGFNGVVHVHGTEENDMSFVLNAGVMDDIRKFNVTFQDKVKSSLYFININPSVLIPSRWPQLQFCLGIGALVQVGQKVSFSWGKSYQGAGYVTSTDSIANYLSTKSRNIMPYISLGMAWDIRQRVKAELTIQPTLLNLYDPGTDVSVAYNTGYLYGTTSFRFNYQPVYVGFKFYYFFKRNGNRI